MTETTTLQIYLFRYFMLMTGCLFLQYTITSSIHYFYHRIQGALANALMCIFTTLYCFALFLVTFKSAYPHAEKFVSFFLFAATSASLFYSIAVSNYLQIKSRLLKLGQITLVPAILANLFNFIYFLATNINLHNQPTANPNSGWFFQTFNFKMSHTTLGLIIEATCTVSFFLILPVIIKALIPIRKSEKLLFYGAIATVLTTLNDVAIGLEILVSSIPLIFLGNIFEAIRFTRHFKDQITSKIRYLEHEVNRLSSLAQTSILAASIIHDIRTPLSLISMLSSKLKKGLTREGIDLEAITDQIQKNSRRVNDITNGYSDLLGNLHSGARENKKIKPLVQEALTLIQKKVLETSAIVSTQIEHNFEVNCRETEMVLVLVNLISNSCDAISELTPRWIKIESQEEENHNLITITDSGSGIPQEIREKIFDFNFSTKDRKKGMGMGLSLVRTVLHNYGFNIRLDDRCPNTRFIIEIPK